ncbi:MAG: hypothetical protein KDJ86_16915 [Bauldia sp.]|uniref:hypothetical protein n=1 Tax=Bauldia sp. TaxID=2575872 RepID=UPI001D7A8A7A|nr:hypothetical protein [Bauldia sp.]MCB1497464.1 hypothetical protein [Bauldia sp.]
MTATATGETPRIRRLIVEAARGLDPWETIPEARLATVAERCGPQEVAEIVTELERLAEEKAQSPDWDGDASDDIWRAQKMYADILGRVDPAFLGDVAKGFASPAGDARIWVALGLESHGLPALPLLRDRAVKEDNDMVWQVITAAIARLQDAENERECSDVGS